MKRVASWVVLPAALACVAAASAWQRPALEQMPETLINGGFLDRRPDMASRSRGMQFPQRGSAAKAKQAFHRGAGHADKPSRGLPGELYWHGVDLPRDPVQAWPWMDSAAARGYRSFIELDDRRRAGLTDAQPARAEAGKSASWAEYADDVAMPRLAGERVRGQRAMTGRRTGFMDNRTAGSAAGAAGRPHPRRFAVLRRKYRSRPNIARGRISSGGSCPGATWKWVCRSRPRIKSQGRD